MTRRRKILILGVCGLVVVVAVWFFCLRNDEPSYNGKRLSEWVDRYSENVPEGTWPSIEPSDATVAIRHIGTNASPLLAHWLVEGAVTEDRIARISGRCPFLKPIAKPLQKRAQRKAERGIYGLQILGTNAISAIPILKEALRTHIIFSVYNDALRALDYVDPPKTNGFYE